MTDGPIACDRARPDDADAVRTLEREAFGTDLGARSLASPPSVSGIDVWVARDASGTVAAFLTSRMPADELEILDVAVRAERRRRGIAETLIRHVLGDAAERGAVRAVLEVADSNRAARALYEKAGFRSCGRRRGVFGGGSEDAWILARPLG